MENADIICIKTEDVCRAMGVKGKAKLEDVQQFIYKVLEFLKKYDLFTSCGCGYVSIMAGPRDAWEKAISEKREINYHYVSIFDNE